MIVSSWCFIVNQISLFLLRTINFLESPTHTYISPPIISCVAANALFNIPIKVRIRTSFLAAAQLEYRPSTSQINSGALGFFCYKTAVKISLEFMSQQCFEVNTAISGVSANTNSQTSNQTIKTSSFNG